MQTYVIKIENPEHTQAARLLRSTLRNWQGEEIMRGLYRVVLSAPQVRTLEQLRAYDGIQYKFLDIAATTPHCPAPRQAMPARARVRRMVPAL